MASLLALVVHAITEFKDDLDKTKNAHNLMFSILITNLAECIETDGHRVCSVGQRKRFILCLQSYYPEIYDPLSIVLNADELLRAASSDFFCERPENSNEYKPTDPPSQQDYIEFIKFSLATAENYYKGKPPHYIESFKQKLKVLLELSDTPDELISTIDNRV